MTDDKDLENAAREFWKTSNCQESRFVAGLTQGFKAGAKWQAERDRAEIVRLMNIIGSQPHTENYNLRKQLADSEAMVKRWMALEQAKHVECIERMQERNSARAEARALRDRLAKIDMK